MLVWARLPPLPSVVGTERRGHDVSTTSIPSEPRVIPPDGGDLFVTPEGTGDRFILDAADVGGAFSLVEHLLAPRALAAPLHLHTAEDEYSYVLEGVVGAIFDGREVIAEAGDLVFKPRGEWHTFWNAGDLPARVLEIISPGGFEEAFHEIHALGDQLSPERMMEIATRYGVEADFEATAPLIERHGLTF